MKQDFSDKIIKLRTNGKICFEIAKLAEKLESKEQELFLNLFDKIKFTKSSQRELAAWILDLIKMGHSISELLMEARTNEIFEDTEINSPQKSTKIKDAIFKIRFPRVSNFLKELDTLRKKINLPKDSKLTALSPLEEGEFKLEFTFDSIESCKTVLNELSEHTLNSKEFKNLFNHMEKD